MVLVKRSSIALIRSAYGLKKWKPMKLRIGVSRHHREPESRSRIQKNYRGWRNHRNLLISSSNIPTWPTFAMDYRPMISSAMAEESLNAVATTTIMTALWSKLLRNPWNHFILQLYCRVSRFLPIGSDWCLLVFTLHFIFRTTITKLMPFRRAAARDAVVPAPAALRTIPWSLVICSLNFSDMVAKL